MVNRGFESWSGQTKFYDLCCFSPMYMYAVLRSNSNDWLDRNQNNVSEWRNMSTACCFCKVPLWKNPTMCVGPVQSVHHHFHRHVTCSRHEISHIFLTRRSTTISTTHSFIVSMGCFFVSVLFCPYRLWLLIILPQEAFEDT